MIAIVDYDMGNVRSVQNAMKAIGAEAIITNKPVDLKNAEKLILPGVGAFSKGMQNLRDYGLVSLLEEQVIDNKKPILGICLGMQLFGKRSYEGGEFAGLGWIDAEVKRITPADTTLKIPHVGWNSVTPKIDNALFNGLAQNPDFYFVHSFYVDCRSDDATSYFDYGGSFTASLQNGHIFGTQFHPEKSQNNGLRLLKNFVEWGDTDA